MRIHPGSLIWPIMILLCACLVLPSVPARAADEKVQLRIDGIDGALRSNVEAVLAIPAGIVKNGIVNRFWLRRLVKDIPSDVRQALEPLGYYHAQIAVESVEPEAGRIDVVVHITPGQPIRLTDRRIEVTGSGSADPVLQAQLGNFPLRQGDIFRHDFYEQGKAQLRNSAVELGYLRADYVTHVVRVDTANGQAAIELLLDTGERYLFGPVSFPSPPEYPDHFLRRYLTFRAGELFSYAALGQTQSQLIDSDRFESVLVTPLIDAAEQSRVPIEIHLKSKPRRTLRPGVGYGTDTGPRFSLLYRDINVWQRGQQFEINLVAAEMRQTFDLSYIIPAVRNINSYSAIKGGLDREETDTYISRKIFTEVEQVYARGKRSALAFFARLQREDYTVGDTNQTSELLIPGMRWSYRTYDSPTRPRKGYHLNLEVRGAREGLLADTSFLQTIGEANTLVRLPARLSLFLRGRGATTLQKDEFEEIPASMRFFAGGDQSVRGFSYQSLGPVDASGVVIGGKHLLVGSAELERALAENWGLAVFYDVGNAFNNLSDYELAKAVGAGLRWYTLIGPVRVDVARPLHVPDPSYRLHFSMGFSW